MGLEEIIRKNLFPDALTEQEMAGIQLDMRNCWEVTEIRGVQAAKYFLALLDIMPADSVFCVETSNLVEEVREFLEANKMPNTTRVLLGSIWPKPDVFHIPFSEQNMRQMAEFAVNFAIPEICDHIHIYKNDEVLLEWFDVFSKPLYISKKFSEDSINDFCSKVGCEYCDGSIPSWPGPG